MDTAAHIARIRTEAELLAVAAEAGPLEARVPGCPDWHVEDLVRHMGDVHRWAATVVRERLQARLRRDFQGPDGREALLSWFREGAAELVHVLEAASADDVFWHWGPAPDALSFWARRQANETMIHRIDVEDTRGAPAHLPAEEALDALDELMGLLPVRGRVPGGHGRTVHLHATDGDGEWVVRLAERVEVSREHARADCALQGSAQDLFLWSMNRRDAAALRVFGDASLLDVWREEVRF